jgi:hypothetical protein
LRAVEERILLLNRMQEQATTAGSAHVAEAATAQVKEAKRGAEALRALVLDDKMFGHLPED